MTSGAGSGTVVVLDCDPDLGLELSVPELGVARRKSLATTHRYDRGRPELEQSVSVATEWTVVQRMVVANLDGEFLARVSRWPQIIAALSRRLSLRTHSLLFQLTLAAFRRIDDRLLQFAAF